MSDLLTIAPGLFVPILMIGVVIFMLFYSRKRQAQIQKDHAHYQAGAIAQRLGIRVEKGDPARNLFIPGKGSMEQQRIDVLLRGERNGVPVELVFFKETQYEQGILQTTVHRSWEGRLTAKTNASFGHFEITLRQPQGWNRVRPYFANPMQEVATGDARTDSLLRVTSDNPTIAASLGGLVSPLTTLNYVHVIGCPGEVSFLMSHSDAGRGNEMIGVGYALHDCELIYDVLTRIVLTAEGRA